MSKKKALGKWIVYCPNTKHRYFLEDKKQVCPACGELLENEESGHIISEDEK